MSAPAPGPGPDSATALGGADSVRALVECCAQQLAGAGLAFGHGTNNAHDEAAWLVLWRLGLALDSDLCGPVGRRPLAPGECAQVAALVAERIRTRKPAAYLTGEAWLQGVPFDVDERAIVPRSLIAELLVGGAIDPFLGAHTRRVLDLCTGNASLAVLAAMAWPEVAVTGSDVCADALAVARRNLARHGLAQRIRLQLADCLNGLPGPWDLIVCNPPYVSAAAMAALPAEYRAEPALALAGGSDGMDFVRRLLRQAPACMAENAVLVLEIGNGRAQFDAAFAQLPVHWLASSAGADQVLLLTRQGLEIFCAAAERESKSDAPARGAKTRPLGVANARRSTATTALCALMGHVCAPRSDAPDSLSRSDSR